ncbi:MULTISPECIES: GNAT family N-acetyltransferase [Gracilibacillus]|uniref:GNAT family N-acetyltransferase n=1 Tax=Gracilibacillus TaxID=74385 RepID=UPI00082433BE|nr:MULTISPECIES: GNAT family N-acetyltransferase [Gracilibacillus]
MLVHKNAIGIRKLTLQDESLLTKWLSDPDVLAYYEGRDQSFDHRKTRKIFYLNGSPTVRCIIEYRQQAIGYIQFYLLDTSTKTSYGLSEKRIYGMDQFIGETSYWNQGIGAQFVELMVVYLVEQLGAQRVVVDPHKSNIRAIRCYEKCGFVKTKTLADHEWHEGDYRDCWLMEYTASNKE